MKRRYMLSDEYRYKILTALEADPALSQRDLASHLGISLGKANYCLRALIEKGLIKVQNFRSSKNKSAYAYVLTPKGLEEKVIMTGAFLRRKLVEYEDLKKEIDVLRRELGIQQRK